LISLDEIQLRSLIERSTQGEIGAFLQNFALDGDKVAFLIGLHVNVAGQDDRSTVAIFLRNRGITNDPNAPVGMHEKQLPRELAVIGGGVRLPFVPTGQIKRVANTLLTDRVRADDRRSCADRGRHLLRSSRTGRSRARDYVAAAAKAVVAAGVAAAAAIVVAVAMVMAGEPRLDAVAQPFTVVLAAIVATAIAARGRVAAHRLRAADRSRVAAHGLRAADRGRLAARGWGAARSRSAAAGLAAAAAVAMEQAVQPLAKTTAMTATGFFAAAATACAAAATTRGAT